MILNTWAISGIIAGVVLIMIVPGLLWLRFNKQGKTVFGHKNEELNKSVERIKKEIREANINVEKNIKILEGEVDLPMITKINDENKLLNKEANRLKRELENKLNQIKN